MVRIGVLMAAGRHGKQPPALIAHKQRMMLCCKAAGHVCNLLDAVYAGVAGKRDPHHHHLRVLPQQLAVTGAGRTGRIEPLLPFCKRLCPGPVNAQRMRGVQRPHHALPPPEQIRQKPDAGLCFPHVKHGVFIVDIAPGVTGNDQQSIFHVFHQSVQHRVGAVFHGADLFH